jgi:hypothetical protein
LSYRYRMRTMCYSYVIEFEFCLKVIVFHHLTLSPEH